jgi:60 kDa SS-A/Ro ribonucleoprotein
MRFNIFKRKEATAVTNQAGASAYKLSPETELYAAIATAGLNDTFYEKTGTRITRIRELMAKNEPEYVAKLAVYARTSMHMRSVPLVLAVELAKQTSGNDIVRKTVNKVVQRADEITELLAYYQTANERNSTKKLGKLSKQLQKGLGDAFNRFDEYQFSKYDRATEITLRDALFLVHPKAKDDGQQALFNKIAAKELATAYTWETELSALGQAQYENKEQHLAAVRAKWQELIESGKLGYMALLRNLRNIMQANVSWQHIEMVCARIENAAEVARSKQLPFRFLSAYREVIVQKSVYANALLSALEGAVIASAQNIKGFDGNTRVMIACDVSGSMQKPVSPKSKVLLYDIGLMLAMLLQSRCKRSVSGMFGDRWKIINMPGRSVLANVQEYYKREGEVGYATNGHLVIEDLTNRKVVMDKVLIFTDCQLYNNTGGKNIQQAWRAYKAIAPAAKLYLFDLAGLGTTPVSMQANDVFLIAGWSDKVFDALDALEDGTDAVKMIKEIVL